MNFKILFAGLATVLCCLSAEAQGYTPEQIPNVHVADRTQYVSNPDGVLSGAAVDSLNQLLGQQWQASTAEPVVVAVADIAPQYSEDDFANNLFTLWGIGKADKHNGLLFLLVRDRHRLVVRVGGGLEGILPDGRCGSINREVAVPYFREDNYDGGMIAVVKAYGAIITDPEHADEIMSQYGNDANASADEMDPFTFLLWAGGIAGVLMLVWVVCVIIASRHEEEQERYRRLNNIRPVALFLSFAGMGLPLPAFLLCWAVMNRLRNHARRCPNCQHTMRKLDEVHDNDYLTPAQDLEERLNSIDYDVWLCPQCGEKDVIPYVNRQSAYTECERCGARTCSMVENRIISQPTTRQEGRGERVYLCRNCGNRTSKPYSIARAASAAPVVIIPGGGGGSGFGGGGFGGGSFGGGGTMGGGASTGW